MGTLEHPQHAPTRRAVPDAGPASNRSSPHDPGQMQPARPPGEPTRSETAPPPRPRGWRHDEHRQR